MRQIAWIGIGLAVGLAGCTGGTGADSSRSNSPTPVVRSSVDPETEFRIRTWTNQLQDPLERDRARQQLVRAGSKAVPFLADALGHAEEPKWRAAIADTLARIGDSDAVEPLISHLGEDTPEILIALQQLTGENFGENKGKWLAWWYERTSVVTPQEAARTRREFHSLTREEKLQTIQATIRGITKIYSLNQLGARGGGYERTAQSGRQTETKESLHTRQRAVPILEAVLESNDPDLLLYVPALARRIGKPAVPALVRGMESTNVSSRAYSARGLGELQAKEGVNALIGALSDPVPEVRLFAIRSLGEIGEPAARGYLEGLLRTEQNYPEAVQASLVQLGQDRYFESLLKGLTLFGQEKNRTLEELWRLTFHRFRRLQRNPLALTGDDATQRQFLNWLQAYHLLTDREVLETGRVPEPKPLSENPALWRRWFQDTSR